MALGGEAELLHAYAIAGFFESLEVSDYFGPVEQFSIDSNGLAEVTFGGGQRCR